MLNKINRLKKNREFSFVYKKGKHISHKYFTIYYVPTKYKASKFGISVSAKVGKSYVRSRVKRVVSEIIRLNLDKIKTNNYVLVLRSDIVGVAYREVEQALLSTLSREMLIHSCSETTSPSEIDSHSDTKTQNEISTAEKKYDC